MNPGFNQGLKRKRYEPPEEELSIRIGGKLHHEIKEVHKASKRAKVFETQKVVKRLKDLRKKDKTDNVIRDFEAELVWLKEIDHGAIGNSALKSKVLKDHTLQDNEDVKSAIKRELEPHLLVPGEPGTALAKIQSRLLSSKILAVQVAASLNSLKILLNPALKQHHNVMDSDAHAETAPAHPFKLRQTPALEDLEPKNKSVKMLPLVRVDDQEKRAHSGIDDAGWESGSVVSDVDNDWGSGSIDSEDAESDEDEVSHADQDSGSDDEVLKVPRANIKTKLPTKTVKGSSSKIESTFLPSLSVAFVPGSDESDWSESESKAGAMSKKNRRGQRARRAIWEKKFGRNANHKKKEAESDAAVRRSQRHTKGANPVRSQGPAESKRNLSRGRNVPQQQQPVDSGWGSRTGALSGANSFRPSASKPGRNNEQPLHPSWEAKRRLKEKESVGIVPSQGTKIKFS